MYVNYYKEQQHNYMVIRRAEQSTGLEYQQKMVTKQKMDSLLATSVRVVDGEIYDYYDITSRLSLRQLYGNHFLDMDEIIRLLSDIKQVCIQVDSFLLDINRLVLEPDYIFYSYTYSKYTFLYNISSQEDELGRIDELMDFLLDKVNTNDKVATELIYKIYEYYEKGKQDIWEIISMIPDEEGAAQPESEVDTESISRDDNLYRLDRDVDKSVVEYDATLAQSTGQNTTSTYSNGFMWQIVLGVLGILGVMACIVIRFMFELLEEERMFLIAGGTLSVVLILVSTLSVMRIVFKEKKKHKESLELQEYIRDELGALDPGKITTVHMNDFVAKSSKRNWSDRSLGDDDNYSNTEVVGDQTVFFEANPSDGGYKLYALDKKNKQHISLDKLPCTIGKMSEFVDCCIDHPTISRLHARIDLKDNQIVVSDLNSTNGVYLNGIRLNPNEERIIDLGDEVRFGTLNYCLRCIL